MTTAEAKSYQGLFGNCGSSSCDPRNLDPSLWKLSAKWFQRDISNPTNWDGTPIIFNLVEENDE